MNVLEEAGAIITGPRREAYGPVEQSFGAVASAWSSILGSEVTAREVALCMIALKVMRDANKPGRDNLVDICGYAALAEMLDEAVSE